MASRSRPIADRAAWQALPEALARRIRAGGDRALADRIPELPATWFLEYTRNGNRSRFEDRMFARRDRLHALVLAECLDDAGTYLDAIVDTVVGHRGGVVLDGAGAPGRAESEGRPARHRRAHRRPVRGTDGAFARVDVVPARRPARQGLAARAAAHHAGDRSPRARRRTSRATTSGGWASRRGRAGRTTGTPGSTRTCWPRRCSSSRRTRGAPTSCTRCCAASTATSGRTRRTAAATRGRTTGPAPAPACSSRSNCCSRRRPAASTCSPIPSSPTWGGSSTACGSPATGS